MRTNTAAILILSFAALAIRQLDAATAHKGAKPKDERVAFFEHAHEIVASQLLDPPTARFSYEMLVRGEDGKPQFACGMVQGKNTYGGYAQPAMYAAEPATGKVFIVQNSLTPEVALSKSYQEGMQWMTSVACPEERRELAPVLPGNTSP